MLKKYIPKQGDIINTDTLGLVLVVSNNIFNERTNRSIVCPISKDSKEYPTHYYLEDMGYVLCENITSIEHKNFNFVKNVSDVLSDITMLIDACIEE